MKRSAANLHVAAVALVRALQGIGSLAVTVTHTVLIVVVIVMLVRLSLPHSQALFEIV
jgi:hypothetical protein